MESKCVRVIHIYPGPGILGGMLTVTQMLNNHWEAACRDFELDFIITSNNGNKLFKLGALFGGITKFVKSVIQSKIINNQILLHIHAADGASFYRKALFVLFARLLGIPVIFQVHGGGFREQVKGRTGSLVVAILNLTTVILIINPAWLDFFKKNIPKSAVKLLPNAVEYSEYKIQNIIKNRVLYMGRFDEKKGYLDLVRAFSLSEGASLGYVLTLVGSGDLDQLHLLIKDSDVKNVEILDWVDGYEKEKIFSETYVFCMPSYAESFGLAPLEAMRRNIPVIVTPVGVMPDVVIPGFNGDIVPIGDIPKLVVSLNYVLKNKEAWEKMMLNTAHSLPAWSDPSLMMQNLRQIYDSALKI